MPKYSVLAEVKILGEVRLPGSEIEILAEDAAPFIEEGKLAEQATEPSPEAGTDANIPDAPNVSSAPSAPEVASTVDEGLAKPLSETPSAPVHQPEAPAEKSWVGGHTV